MGKNVKKFLMDKGILTGPTTPRLNLFEEQAKAFDADVQQNKEVMMRPSALEEHMQRTNPFPVIYGALNDHLARIEEIEQALVKAGLMKFVDINEEETS